MKRNFVAAFALLSTALTSTPAFAVSTPSANAADPTTLTAMQSQCDVLAAAHDTANGDLWSAQVVEGAVTLVAGPTEVGGSRVIDQSSIVGTGTYVPGALYISGSPYKTGGSVNMFGDQWSSAGYYPTSTYNFTANFASTFSHAFSCNISQAIFHALVEGAHHDAVHHDRTGVWVVDPDAQGNEEANTNNCNAFNGSLPAGPANGGNTQANCLYNESLPAYDDPAYDDPDIPAYNDSPVIVGNEPGSAISQDQTDNLDGFEPNGPRVNVTAEYFVGKAVICISPTKNPGTWRVQNGYGGGSFTNTSPATPGCNTNWFKVAPTNSGSTTSQGTFISVPQYNL